MCAATNTCCFKWRQWRPITRRPLEKCRLRAPTLSMWVWVVFLACDFFFSFLFSFCVSLWQQLKSCNSIVMIRLYWRFVLIVTCASVSHRRCMTNRSEAFTWAKWTAKAVAFHRVSRAKSQDLKHPTINRRYVACLLWGWLCLSAIGCVLWCGVCCLHYEQFFSSFFILFFVKKWFVICVE